MIQFHRSDMAVVDGKKCAMLNQASGWIFYNLWSQRGKWVSISELLTNKAGDLVPSEDPPNLVQAHIFKIRQALRKAEIDLVIENQHQSFWAESKYRLL